MTDAPFVLAGWLGTASAIGLYVLNLRIRSRRAAAAVRRRAS
jgi:hypothetical protein